MGAFNELVQKVRVSYERVCPEGTIEVVFKVDGICIRFWPESGAAFVVLANMPSGKEMEPPDYEKCLQDLLGAFK